MKIIRSFAAALFLAGFVSAVASASDFALRITPSYNVPGNSQLQSAIGGTAGVEFDVLNLRGRDSVFVGAVGGVLPVKGDGFDDLYLLNGGAVLGYNVRFSDRFSLTAEGFGGIYSISEDTEQNFDAESGLMAGGRGSFNVHLLPELRLGLSCGYTKFLNKNEPVVPGNLDIGISFRYSLTKGLFSKSDVVAMDSKFNPLFPVFYSRYDDHPFGSMTFVNNESNSISDVEVYVFIEQFMSNPSLAFKVKSVKMGESFTADLTAFLDESVLNNFGASETTAVVSVSYKSLGKRIRMEEPVVLTTLSRNSMTWEDDRQAAAFASGHDASAYLFANRVKSIVKDSLTSGVPENIQYAAAIFGALKVYGINYVVDPASAFTDNVGTASVDFLQFPYQTLMYHGGDCDDLTILNCSLLEAIGIDTAMITIPGHIYMAFDAGVSPADAAKAGDCVVIDGKVWIPLEITLSQDTFTLERQTGIRQWRKNKGEAALIPMKDAWAEFKAVTLPDSDVKMDLPSSSAILNEFKKQF